MASGHDIFQDMYGQYRSNTSYSEQYVEDPGSGGTFNLRQRDQGYAIIASGSRKLPADAPPGVTLRVIATGSVTITNSASSTIKTLASGEIGVFTSRGSGAWVGDVQFIGNGSPGSQAVPASQVSLVDSNDYWTADTAQSLADQVGPPTFSLPNSKYVSVSTAAPFTATAGHLTGARHVYYECTTDGGVALTTRTATQLYGDLPAGVGFTGFSYDLTIVNRGSGTITITLGSGCSAVGTGELTIATLTTRTYVVTFTSATTATLASVNKGTIET